jgi:hypothetical protein
MRRILAIVAVAVAACQSTDQRFPLLARDPSVGPLRSEVESALAALAEARGALRPDVAKSDAAIGRAQQTLRDLADFYLPLLETRQRACYAYELASAGRSSAARSELDAVEAILLEMAKVEAGPVVRGLEEPLDLLEEARLALAAGASGSAEPIAALANRLSLMLDKGRLVVRDSG